MRLLFDEQLSEALPALLDDVFPGSLPIGSLEWVTPLRTGCTRHRGLCPSRLPWSALDSCER
jgi:hypothetical protein